MTSADAKVLRYSKQSLYVLDPGEQNAGICERLRQLGLEFEQTESVKNGVGLPRIAPERRRQIQNIVPADADGAVVLLGRVKSSQHDLLSQSRLITPIVDFLLKVPGKQLVANELKLGFLVPTANNKKDRRQVWCHPPQDQEAVKRGDLLREGLFRQTLAEVDPEWRSDLHRLLSYEPGHYSEPFRCPMRSVRCKW